MTKKICFLLLLIPFRGFAQEEADSIQVQSAVAHSLQLYQLTMHAQSGLYNGSRYRPPPHSLDQHPFYHSGDWLQGDLLYDGISFTDVPLMYDMTSGQLITEHHSSGQPIQLIQPRVTEFNIAGHHFRKFDSASSGGSLRGKDFYDVLYNGPSSVIARRNKAQHKQIYAGGIEITYEENARYYILRNGVFLQVKSRASAFALFGDEKRNLKKHLRKKPLPPGSDRETAFVTIAALYDTLNAQE